MPVYFEGQRKKVRYGRDLVEVRYAKKKEAFAVFSADDNSLNFYKRIEVPEPGSQFEGKTVTEVYTGIEEGEYSYTTAPWHGKQSNITNSKVVDVIKPVSTRYWFYGCSSLASLDVSMLDTSKVTNMSSMFNDCWRLQQVKLGDKFAWMSRNGYLPTPNTHFIPMADGKWYALSDGKGYAPSEIPSNKADTYYAYPPKAFAVYSDDDKSLNFYKRFSVPKAGTQFEGKTATDVYTGIENDQYDANSTPWTQNRKSITNVMVVDNIEPLSTAFWFYFFMNMTEINLNKLNTSQVVNMSNMFYGCKSLTSLNVSNFNTSQVTDMNYMFRNCRSLTSIDLSHFNTCEVTSMGFMFAGCESLTSLNVSSFDTSKVTNMSNMFNDCESLTSLNVSSFDTSKVTNMNYMFNGCVHLTSLDLSNFDTSQVAGMYVMFEYCYYLQQIKLGNKFEWKDTSGYLPEPDSVFIPGADGKWYALSDGAGYAPSEIPSNKADAYYAYPPTEVWVCTINTEMRPFDVYDYGIHPSKTTTYRVSSSAPQAAYGRGTQIVITNNSGYENRIYLAVSGSNTQTFELEQGDYNMNVSYDCQSGYSSRFMLEEKMKKFAPIS